MYCLDLPDPPLAANFSKPDNFKPLKPSESVEYFCKDNQRLNNSVELNSHKVTCESGDPKREGLNFTGLDQFPQCVQSKIIIVIQVQVLIVVFSFGSKTLSKASKTRSKSLGFLCCLGQSWTHFPALS